MCQIHGWEARTLLGDCRVLGGKELVNVEVAHHLLGDLCQDTLSQCLLGSILELSERHEMHDISIGDITCKGVQGPTIAIQELHGPEVGAAHFDYDDGRGKLGGTDYNLSGLVRVCDNALSDDQKHKILKSCCYMAAAANLAM